MSELELNKMFYFLSCDCIFYRVHLSNFSKSKVHELLHHNPIFDVTITFFKYDINDDIKNLDPLKLDMWTG